jgi:hypothetical protein
MPYITYDKADFLILVAQMTYPTPSALIPSTQKTF